MKYWEVIAENLSKGAWSWGCVDAVDPQGGTIFVADAHRDGKRFIVRADEKLTAFLELEAAIWASGEPPDDVDKNGILTKAPDQFASVRADKRRASLSDSTTP
jgi:hypothetical protein